MLAAVSNAALATRSILVEKRWSITVRTGDSATAMLSREKASLTQERAALVRALAGMPLIVPFLSGVSAADSTMVTIEGPTDGVYYLASPSCAACAANLPFLDTLARRKTLRVVVIVRDASASELSQYAQAHESSLLFLSRPSGYIEQVTPRWATPLSVVVLGGRLQSIIVGRLSASEQRELMAIDPKIIAGAVKQ